MGVLLDTFTLYELVTAPEQLLPDAVAAIAENQVAGRLYVSPITAWELSLASKKPVHKDPPDLGKLTAASWFQQATAATGARIIPVKLRIAYAAALVPEDTGHKDPGDCILIATAKVRKLPIITRDAKMIELAADGYIDVIRC